MRKLSFAEAQKALQAIMDQKGEKLFEGAKSAYLEDVIVVDENDEPIADLDIQVKASAKTETKSADSGDLDTKIAGAVASAVTKAFAANKSDRPNYTEKKAAPYIKRFGGYTVKNFKGSRDEAQEKAARFGYWFAGTMGVGWAVRGCKSMGIDLIPSNERAEDFVGKAHTEGVNTAGGFLVNQENAPDLIRLVEEYGVFRRNARVRPMTTDELQIKRRTSGLTGYWTGEAVAATESTMAFDRVTLTASKLTALTTASIELVEDAAVSIGDLVAQEIALTFANKEDQAGFNGDGTSTYGGYTGILQRLVDINQADEGGGLEEATSKTYASITAADINLLMARVQALAGLRPKFYCSQQFYGAVMHRTAQASGGTTFAEASDGSWQYRWNGVPVEIVNVMPTATSGDGTADTIHLLYGDMSMACSFGDRMQMSIATSDSALNAFEQGEIAIRGIERVGINCHDLGTSTAGGPLVGLILPA